MRFAQDIYCSASYARHELSCYYATRGRQTLEQHSITENVSAQFLTYVKIVNLCDLYLYAVHLMPLKYHQDLLTLSSINMLFSLRKD